MAKETAAHIRREFPSEYVEVRYFTSAVREYTGGDERVTCWRVGVIVCWIGMLFAFLL